MNANNLKVVFFEWSDIKRQPIGFNCVDDFKNFCKEHRILITSNNNYYLTNNEPIYAICKNGKSELVLSGTLKGLKKNFNKHNRNAVQD